MADNRSKALDYAHQNSGQFLNSLKEFVRIPSVSTEAALKGEMTRAAQWVADQLTEHPPHPRPPGGAGRELEP
jgi:acetylornithine deacetylase/succinyl-diaminopimelate desuccinylase-like protein